MIGILLVTHGQIGRSLIDCSSNILGKSINFLECIPVDPKSDLQLSEQIELLITNESLRKNKSQQARKLALKFSWDQNTEQFCKILNRLSK